MTTKAFNFFAARSRATRLIGAMTLVLLSAAVQAQPASDARLTTFACDELVAAAPRPGSLRVTYFGVSTLLFDDGETQFMTDGFFTRPDPLTILIGPISPHPRLISGVLSRAGITRLSAVIPLHSHLDHVLDATEVATQMGALLIGSESTANVGRGWKFPEERIRVFHHGQKFTFGRFEIEVILARHSPGSDGGTISQPLAQPARANQYLEGGTYSLLITHGGRKLLVGGPGAAGTVRADVVFIALAVASTVGDDYWRDIWQRHVIGTGARRVIPVHWDFFSLPLERGLVPLQWPDVGKVLRFMQGQGQTAGVDVKCALLWGKVDPFAGISP